MSGRIITPSKLATEKSVRDIQGADFDSGTDSLHNIKTELDSFVAKSENRVTFATEIPRSIDIGAMVTPQVFLYRAGVLPPVEKINEGEYKVDRKAKDSDEWVSVIAFTPSSKNDGVVYANIEFSTANGFDSGDSVRVTFKDISVTKVTKAVEIPTMALYSRIVSEDVIEEKVDAIKGVVDDIKSETDKIQGISDDIGSKGVGDDLHIKADTIIERTDRLPDIPADEVNATANKDSIETAISTAEGNIRGGTHDIEKVVDDLATLSTAVGVSDGKIDDVKAVTDEVNFNAELNKEVLAQTNRFGVDARTELKEDVMGVLNTAEPATVNADSVYDRLNDIKGKTDNLPDSPADEDTLTAIKGGGWTNETLKEISDKVATETNATSNKNSIESAINDLNDISVSDIEDSEVLAKESTSSSIEGKVDLVKSETDKIEGISGDVGVVDGKVGETTDLFPLNETVLGHQNALYKHIHNPALCYPTLSDGVTVASDDTTAWELGVLTEIIPEDTITEAYDIHYINFENASNVGTYELHLFKVVEGTETLIAKIRTSRDSNQSGTSNVPVQVPIIEANAGLSARLASNVADRNVTLSVYYHTYE